MSTGVALRQRQGRAARDEDVRVCCPRQASLFEGLPGRREEVLSVTAAQLGRDEA